jgi:hypothetical protein
VGKEGEIQVSNFLPEDIKAENPELATLTDAELHDIVDRQLCEAGDREWIYTQHRWIKDKAGKVRPMKRLKLAQRKTVAVLKWCRENKVAPRIIIGKSRKQGESTIIGADCYEEVKQHQLDALILAHDKAGVSKIFRIYQRFYQHDDLNRPEPYKGKVNLREMRFQDHDGHITIATAHNIYAGTGETPQYIHCSEGSKWENGEETLTALNQSIGDGPETTMIHESTFNGEEACFLPIWRAANDNSKLTFTEDAEENLIVDFKVTNPVEWNHYIPLFISVLDDEDARLKFLNEEEKAKFLQTIDDYERHLIEDLHATAEFLNWRRRTLKLKCKNDIDVLKQEYPCTSEEAIRASGRPRFNIGKLDSMPVEDGQFGGLRYTDSWDKRIVWKPDPQGELIRFREPQPGHAYIIGCDPAEGSSLEEEAIDPRNRLDASAIEVYDIDKGNEQVAMYHSITTPEALASPLLMLALYYNNAFVVIENNSSGRTTCIKMQETYDNSLLYHEDDWNPEKTRRQRSVGHKTTSSNREHIISLVADAINEDDVVFHSKLTVAEHKYFIYTKTGRPEAARGHHDDHVMATAKAFAGMPMARAIRQIKVKQARSRSQSAQRRANTVKENRSYA